MPLSTEKGLGLGHIVFTWGPSSPLPVKRAQQPPNFRLMSILAKWSPISATAELLLVLFVQLSHLDMSGTVKCHSLSVSVPNHWWYERIKTGYSSENV